MVMEVQTIITVYAGYYGGFEIVNTYMTDTGFGLILSSK